MKKSIITIFFIFSLIIQASTAQPNQTPGHLHYQTYDQTTNHQTQSGTTQNTQNLQLLENNKIHLTGYLEILQTGLQNLYLQANGQTTIWLNHEPILHTTAAQAQSGTNETIKLPQGWHYIEIHHTPDGQLDFNLDINDTNIFDLGPNIQPTLNGLQYEKFDKAIIRAIYRGAVAGLPDYNALPAPQQTRTTRTLKQTTPTIQTWPGHDYAVRALGYLTIHQTDTYTFTLNSQNRSLLYINQLHRTQRHPNRQQTTKRRPPQNRNPILRPTKHPSPRNLRQLPRRRHQQRKTTPTQRNAPTPTQSPIPL